MSKTSQHINAKGLNYLESSTTTTCTLADNYYKIGGTWTDCGCPGLEFTDNKITVLVDGNYLFNGVSDLKVDTAGLLYYALYKNGVLVTSAQTPHTFTSAAKTEGIAITSILVGLVKGDYLEIYVKHDNAGTVVTHDTLFLTVWGDR